MKHIHCPVNGYDCPYYTDEGHPCRCTLAHPEEECDDFLVFWDPIEDDGDWFDDDWNPCIDCDNWDQDTPIKLPVVIAVKWENFSPLVPKII